MRITIRTDEGENEQYEVDLVANSTSKRYYIQSPFAISDEEKRKLETR